MFRVEGHVGEGIYIGLKSDTNYIAEVRAYNSAGLGPRSETYLVETKHARKLLVFVWLFVVIINIIIATTIIIIVTTTIHHHHHHNNNHYKQEEEEEEEEEEFNSIKKTLVNPTRGNFVVVMAGS